MKPQWIIFTDLDGTLLDHETYAWDAAEEALKTVRDRQIPLIICSSKTRSEIEMIRDRLELHGPFIVENGGGIFSEKGHHSPFLEGSESLGRYEILKLGLPYDQLRAVLLEISFSTGIPVRGFGDMSADEISNHTGLSREDAARAQNREFDEPFILEGTPEQEARFLKAIESRELRWTRGGRFYHLTGKNDKGRAVRILKSAYSRALGPLNSVGIGDSPNDLPMLKAVDYPVLVQKPGGTFDPLVDFPGLHKAGGVGPLGWNRAILGLLGRKDAPNGSV